MYALEHIARTVELFPHMSAMMKVAQEPRTFIAARSIGSGIQNLLFADPRTVQDVEECVKATRSECPGQSRGQGIHGVGMQRDVGVVLCAPTTRRTSAARPSSAAHPCARGRRRQGGWHAGVGGGSERRGVRADDREASGGGGPRAAPLRAGRRHGPVRRHRLSAPLDHSPPPPLAPPPLLEPADHRPDRRPPPADSVSIGQPGQDGRPGTTKHPKVEEAELKTIKTAQRMGIAMRIEADPNKILGPTVVRPNAAL